MTREEIIEGLLGIHAVTANYKGDQVILHSMPMPRLTGILYGAAELLKAEGADPGGADGLRRRVPDRVQQVICFIGPNLGDVPLYG